MQIFRLCTLHFALGFRLPARTRTWDPLIKSQLLYRLSYGEKTAAKILKFN